MPRPGHASLRVRVAVGAVRRDLRDGDAFAGEHGVEGGGELRIAVTDQVGEVGGPVAELPQQVSGLLSGPDGCGTGGDAKHVHGARPDFHDEQRVQPLQPDGVDVKEISGQKTAGLGFEERDPLTSHHLPLSSRAKAGGSQNAADGGCADLVPQAAYFAVDRPKPPTRVVGTNPNDQVAELNGYRRASW